MLNQTLRQEAEAARGGYAVATGFKWMLSQRAGRHWPWFVELCRDFGVRLVFLLRRNAARQLVSRLLNAEDKARAQAGGPRHSAHPNSESRLDELRSRRVTFRRDQVLEQLQDMHEKWDELERLRLYALARGVPSARVVYEDVDADHSLVGNLSDFLLADVGAEERANCAAAFASRPPPQGHEKIHTSSLEDVIVNFKEVWHLLHNTPWRHCLAEEPHPPPDPGAVVDASSSLYGSNSRPCWEPPGHFGD